MFLIGGNVEVLVSDSDVDLLVKYRWTLHKDGYVIEDINAYEDDPPKAARQPFGYLVLHHEIFKRCDAAQIPLKATQRVKHLNANFLDNRRENLGLGNWVETDQAWWEEYAKWKASIQWLEKFM